MATVLAKIPPLPLLDISSLNDTVTSQSRNELTSLSPS